MPAAVACISLEVLVAGCLLDDCRHMVPAIWIQNFCHVDYCAAPSIVIWADRTFNVMSQLRLVPTDQPASNI